MNRAERRREARQVRRVVHHGPWCAECQGHAVIRHPDDPCHLHEQTNEHTHDQVHELPHCCGVLVMHDDGSENCSAEVCSGIDQLHRMYADCSVLGSCSRCER